MKTLLITNYWYPYNHSGTMRWLQLANAGLEFDVLTQRKPREGFIDETLPATNNKVFKVGRNIPAVFWDITLVAVCMVFKYDCIIITVPPQTLLFTAYILQKIHRRVVIDVRDSIDGWDNKLKPVLSPVLKWIYKRIKNKVVSFQFLDESAYVVRSGYADVTRDSLLKNNGWSFFKSERGKYYSWITCCEFGLINDYRNKPKGYGSSSFCTLRHLGYQDLPIHFHPEVHNCELNSWSEAVELYKNYISGVNNGLNVERNRCTLYEQISKCAIQV